MRRLIFSLILLVALAAAAVILLHVFDEKGRCLDYGGHYDDVNQTCMK